MVVSPPWGPKPSEQDCRQWQWRRQARETEVGTRGAATAGAAREGALAATAGARVVAVLGRRLPSVSWGMIAAGCVVMMRVVVRTSFFQLTGQQKRRA